MKKTFILLSFLFAIYSNAAVFNIPNGDVTALINAINTANSNSEADIINLATNGTYTLTAVNYTSSSPGSSGYEGQRGLPNILNTVSGLDLTINGNGATIQRNTSAVNFGLFSCSGYTIFNNVIFRNGKVNAQGAAIFVQFKGNVECNNCSFYDNESLINVEGGGGSIYTKSLSILKIDTCYFEGNKAVNQGGAISNLLSNLTVLNSTFKNNSTTDVTGGDTAGGAIYDDGARGDNGFLIIRNSIFEGNACTKGQGGALFLFPYNNNSAEVTACTFKNNTAEQGGGFWHSGGSVNIPDSEYPFTGLPENTTLLFNSCIFDGNQAKTQAGGLWIKNGIISDIYNCTFKNNVAYNGTDGLGGAIFLFTSRAVTLRNNTFNNNTSKMAGAIAFNQALTAQVTNCTFDGNIAHAYGGAVSVPQNDATRAVSFTNCTFANNQANNSGNGQSGAIHSGDNSGNNSVTIKNCLFYNQTVTNPWNVWKHCNSVLVDGGNNLFFPENASGRCVSTANPLIVDPLLSPLASNGGTTQTMALQAGSPAINAGSGCPTFDQRGATRVGICDIGAFEFGGVLSIDKIISSEDDVLVYPNPSNGIFYIDVKEPQNSKIQIFDLSGRLLFQKKYNSLSTLPIEFNQSGTYLINIQSDKINKTSKIIVR